MRLTAHSQSINYDLKYLQQILRIFHNYNISLFTKQINELILFFYEAIPISSSNVKWKNSRHKAVHGLGSEMYQH